MATSGAALADEEFAKALQKQFDEELLARESQETEDQDIAFAVAEGTHNLSDSSCDTNSSSHQGSADLFNSDTNSEKAIEQNSTFAETKESVVLVDSDCSSDEDASILQHGLPLSDNSYRDTNIRTTSVDRKLLSSSKTIDTVRDMTKTQRNYERQKSTHTVSWSGSDESPPRSPKSRLKKKSSSTPVSLLTGGRKRRLSSGSGKASNAKRPHSEVPSASDSDSDATIDLEDEPCKKESRPVCKYGQHCYRKNPSHLEEFWHPDKKGEGNSEAKISRVQGGHATPTRPGTSTGNASRMKGGHGTPITPGTSTGNASRMKGGHGTPTTPGTGTGNASRMKGGPGTPTTPGTSTGNASRMKGGHGTPTTPGTSNGNVSRVKGGHATPTRLGTSTGNASRMKGGHGTPTTPGTSTGNASRVKGGHATPTTPVPGKLVKDYGGGSPPSKRKASPTAASERKTPCQLVDDSQPLGFFLTRVTGIASKFNDNTALHIQDLLSPSMGNLLKSAQFNYKIDIPWLVAQYDVKFRRKPLLVVHGAQRQEKAALDMEASVFDHVRLCQAKLDIMFGTHHTKMMLLLYDNGMRIVIHTSNLIHQDWHQKTQGIWVSPLFPRLPQGSATDGDSRTHFKRDMVEYLAAYKARPLEDWITHCKEHDMSSAKVFLIGSVPGRHQGERKSAFGHLKLRKVLGEHFPVQLGATSAITWPVVAQFSSVGSLGPQPESWLVSEFLDSLTAAKGKGPRLGTAKAKLHLMYPCKENVRESLEGYPAGGSLPYSIETAKKQTYMQHYWHRWKADIRGRSRASPHIKSYLRASPDWTDIAWFLITSANLSKAAWGGLEKAASQLMIRSYELGVLALPERFGKHATFQAPRGELVSLPPYEHGSPIVFPLPYDLPPTRYGDKDRPWVWDIPYMDKPDCHGNMWCPPL